MNARDFIAAMPDPIVRYASLGQPAGVDVAYFGDADPPELGFDLGELDGEVRPDGVWAWNGEGHHRDGLRNTIVAVWIRNDPMEWLRQRIDWEASV